MNMDKICGVYLYHWIKIKPAAWFVVHKAPRKAARAVLYLKGNICTPGQTRHHLRIAHAR